MHLQICYCHDVFENPKKANSFCQKSKFFVFWCCGEKMLLKQSFQTFQNCITVHLWREKNKLMLIIQFYLSLKLSSDKLLWIKVSKNERDFCLILQSFLIFHVYSHSWLHSRFSGERKTAMKVKNHSIESYQVLNQQLQSN